jgi:glycosyltransferase involved in cell wall biosynthesis
MPKPATLSVVIPAYNEERRLPDTIRQLTAFLVTQPWDWEIRVVDDGSTDGTASAVEQAAIGDARIVLQREPHRGKGGAVRAGMLGARAQFRFLCDADLSMPAAELPRFLPPVLTGADVAIGSREGAGARRVGEPWRRHITGRVFNWAIQAIAVRGILDTQCGFKMFTAAAADRVFSNVTLEGWAFDVEALAIARALGFRIVDVPIEWHYRPESQVNVTRDAWRMLADVWSVRTRARRGTLVRHRSGDTTGD